MQRVDLTVGACAVQIINLVADDAPGEFCGALEHINPVYFTLTACIILTKLPCANLDIIIELLGKIQNFSCYFHKTLSLSKVALC
jgi:hypothetical protein